MCTFQGVTCLDAYGVTRAVERQPAVGISGAQDLGPGAPLRHTAVEAAGQQIHAAKVDVRDFDGLSAALNAGIEKFGRLDVVVANAGVCSAKMSWEISAEQCRRPSTST